MSIEPYVSYLHPSSTLLRDVAIHALMILEEYYTITNPYGLPNREYDAWVAYRETLKANGEEE